MGTRGSEASYYPQEKKSTEIPGVTASETGGGQTEPLAISEKGCGVVDSCLPYFIDSKYLERYTIEGDSPVEEDEKGNGEYPEYCSLNIEQELGVINIQP